MAITVAVGLINGSPPERSSLKPFIGEVIKTRVSKSRGLLYAEIRARADSRNVILFQRMPEGLASKAVQPLPGTAIAALIAPDMSTDAWTGLERRSLWQLSVKGVPVVSFEELVEFHAREAAGERTFALSFGAVGIASLIARWWRRHRRANP